MLDRCDSFNGAIIILCRCDKLLIFGYISAQVVDSKVGQLIYPLRKVNLIKLIQNEPISIRNIREIHENSKKCYFNWILKPIGLSFKFHR